MFRKVTQFLIIFFNYTKERGRGKELWEGGRKRDNSKIPISKNSKFIKQDFLQGFCGNEGKYVVLHLCTYLLTKTKMKCIVVIVVLQ